MSDAFDPYYIWLGIPLKDQPANYYRLLGLQDLEENVDVIDAAANRQATYLHEMAAGPNRKESQELLNEIAAARRCLLNPESKKAYDETIRTKQAAAEASKIASVPVAKAVIPAAPVIKTGEDLLDQVPSFDFTAPSPAGPAVSIDVGQSAPDAAESNNIHSDAAAAGGSDDYGSNAGGAGKKSGSKQLVIAGCSMAVVAIAAFAFSGGGEPKQKSQSTGTSKRLDGSGTVTTTAMEVAADNSESSATSEENAPKKKPKPSQFDQASDQDPFFQVPSSFGDKQKKKK
jgi:hypothetical protein